MKKVVKTLAPVAITTAPAITYRVGARAGLITQQPLRIVDGFNDARSPEIRAAVEATYEAERATNREWLLAQVG